MKLTNIVFTRNRPLQLEAYLRSFHRFYPEGAFNTIILHRVDLFGEQYEELFRTFRGCRVIREDDFNRDFLQILSGVETEYVNFGTDDVVYFDSVDLDIVESTFKTFENSIFGFSLRMSPESISGTRIRSHRIDDREVYSVNWKTAKDKTARYPFELNGTIYRTKLVGEIVSHICSDKVALRKIFAENSPLTRIMNKIFPMKSFLLLLNAFRNPNSLEGYGYRWVKTHRRRYPSELFFHGLCCSAIQVNIVNTIVNNPIDGGEAYTVESLNREFKRGHRFDVDFMIRNKPQETHVGKEFFRLT
ncbi:MAG: hypothetical protein P8Z79_01195 [Sedimentisphaerales bacterium]